MAKNEGTNQAEQQPQQDGNSAVAIQGRNGGTLNPFVPGQSGNPNGRPKGSRSLKSLMNKLLDEQVLFTVDDAGNTIQLTRREALMLQKLQLAMSSEYDAVRLAAIKDIEDRLEGRPLPQFPDGGTDGEADYCVFYIPNAHSRKQRLED